MRWDALFGDLDAQWHAVEQRELEAEVNELARIELAQSTLADALRGSLGGAIAATLRSGAVLHGELLRVAPEWLLLGSAGRCLVVPMAALAQVRGAGGVLAADPARIPYTLPAALRLLARNRAVVTIEVDGGRSLRGVLDRVGVDHVQLAVVVDGATRRHDNVRGSVLIPLRNVLVVASGSDNEF
ncbi:LSm family protein [Specibacter cremeus]|uniref:LSm family protein n=1 Tax=Specibacter cremeus TaxID=1629051 RepID=UPI000F79293E|nr:LSm family protein [Specibacter cremeus]